MSIDEIVRKVLRYKPFFDTSAGGVSLSGGEPAFHLEFTSALLKRFKEERIHTLLETSGFFDFDQFKALILPYIDTIYFDIKLIDWDEERNVLISEQKNNKKEILSY